MKASALIKELQIQIALHGDLTVLHDSGGTPDTVHRVEYNIAQSVYLPAFLFIE